MVVVMVAAETATAGTVMAMTGHVAAATAVAARTKIKRFTEVGLLDSAQALDQAPC